MDRKIRELSENAKLVLSLNNNPNQPKLYVNYDFGEWNLRSYSHGTFIGRFIKGLNVDVEFIYNDKKIKIIKEIEGWREKGGPSNEVFELDLDKLTIIKKL